jgi:formate hydrogenlyase subunit 3/multisubunit Na+/H+ antiporter MnhD subunit
MDGFGAFGKVLIILGIILIAIGGLFMFGNKIPFIGKLPGDIVVHKKNFHFYFPLTTSIIISIILSLIMWLLSRR